MRSGQERSTAVNCGQEWSAVVSSGRLLPGILRNGLQASVGRGEPSLPVTLTN